MEARFMFLSKVWVAVIVEFLGSVRPVECLASSNENKQTDRQERGHGGPENLVKGFCNDARFASVLHDEER